MSETTAATNGTSGTNGTANGTVRFEFNLPETVALKYAEGLPVEGRYGPQVMFSLADGRKMYVGPDVADRITKELGAKPGEQFTITKQEQMEGRKRGVRWALQRVSAAAAVETPKAPVEAAPPAAMTTNTTQIQQQNGCSSSAVPNGSNGHGGAAAEILDVQRMYGSSLCTAIDALITAQRYGAMRGMTLEFNEEDVRAVATTIFIQASKGRAA